MLSEEEVDELHHRSLLISMADCSCLQSECLAVVSRVSRAAVDRVVSDSVGKSVLKSKCYPKSNGQYNEPLSR